MKVRQVLFKNQDGKTIILIPDKVYFYYENYRIVNDAEISVKDSILTISGTLIDLDFLSSPLPVSEAIENGYNYLDSDVAIIEFEDWVKWFKMERKFVECIKAYSMVQTGSKQVKITVSNFIIINSDISQIYQF